jgi:hypothetical protein
MFSIQSSTLDISVRRNPDRDHARAFPIVLEVASQEGEITRARSDVANLISALKTQGIDFEALPDDIHRG